MKVFSGFRKRFHCRNVLVRKTTGFFILASWLFVLSVSFQIGRAATFEEAKDSLRQQIDGYQQQIDAYRATIKDLQQQGSSLNREISLLDTKIKAANLEVLKLNLAIKQTESEIGDKNTALEESELKIGQERESLGECIRLINDYDEKGLLEMILQNDKLSDIFDEISSFENLQKEIQTSIEQIRQLKVDLAEDKEILEDRREELNQLKVAQEIQKRTIVIQQNEKKMLLSQTKGQETNYQKLLSKTKTDVASIREQLYLLEGVGLSMSLEQAYNYAQKVFKATGVRPAFLLAVLKNESSWGEKVGTGTWRKDMHKRDQSAFLQICDKLGYDPDKMPVSRKPSYGWGGAMGPAQFLPSVWLSYEAQVAKLTGHNPPDPWSIEDSFMAAGVKLAQGGANQRTSQAEWKAAQIYFAGSRWNNPSYYFYGDQVMETAVWLQSQLDIIGG